MAAGVGFPGYPQQPSPAAAEIGSQAEAAAMQRQLAALARSKPGYLPYAQGVGATMLGPTTMPSGAPTTAQGAPTAAPAGLGVASGIGAALMARKQAHAQHLAALGMSDTDTQAFTQGGSNG